MGSVERVVLMIWEEFVERFLVSFEEFKFKYKEKIISLVMGDELPKFLAIVSLDISDKSLFYRFKHRKDYISFERYENPYDLLNNFKIDGKTLKELWDVIES